MNKTIQIESALLGWKPPTMKRLTPTYRIYVNRLDSDHDITVQTGYRENGEFVMESCNHGGAMTEELVSAYDPSEVEDALVCDKCGAIYDEAGGCWE